MIRENPEADSIQTDDEQPGNGEKVENEFEIHHLITIDNQNGRSRKITAVICMVIDRQIND